MTKKELRKIVKDKLNAVKKSYLLDKKGIHIVWDGSVWFNGQVDRTSGYIAEPLPERLIKEAWYEALKKDLQEATGIVLSAAYEGIIKTESDIWE